MKKLIFTLSLFCAFVAPSFAQQCNTGTSNCTIVVLPKPGLSPVSDSLAPVVDNVATNTTINFQNFDTITFGGHTLTVDSLHIDTINNLPSGLCWATSSGDNTFANQQNGCINVTGTTAAAPGQYKLYIAVDAYVPFKVHTLADAAGLFYYVRVNCSPDVHTRAVDTTGTYLGKTYWTYDSACSTTYTAIKNLDQNIQSLNVFPNPFNNQATVTFNSAKSGMMTEKITTVIGSEVFRSQMEVNYGVNTHTINRNNLAAGVYFYTISDGISTFTKRLVITE